MKWHEGTNRQFVRERQETRTDKYGGCVHQLLFHARPHLIGWIVALLQEEEKRPDRPVRV